ncbi:TIGR03111 family XrtG-associated glycosyltransferase [Tepidiforma sp.]|uniref:TIGR03111 family XrtG-associated glycosyltransferase n=1 Tax=Tepidiforma sp. TaxID=2682230 RepID=UPI0026173477|nr:TIGR03111 family XrtG-associated glycosyltransferase [Tepidiforma sp.]MCX7617862.1 putative glycosyltransferase, exosortase G system-associated [Tepidiforma sp.]
MTTDWWLPALGFWGVWLFVPILVDGYQAFNYLAATILGRAKRLPIRPVTEAPRGKWPRVTIIVPVYNSQEQLGACLQSIKRQSYPNELIEVLAIDNGSKDDSYRVFCEEQQADWPGQIHWMSTFHQGKTWALNAGIHFARGDYIINVDSDVVLHEDAVANMVAAFEHDEDLIAATGAVEIRPEAGERGWMRLLHECEFQEYYFSFNVGRRFETLSRRLFTLAGAFSAFRREALLATHLYDASTVGEDTFMTFELQERFPGKKVGVVPSAVCYTDPIPSLKALYSQRVRWQRGEIEVIAAHPKLANRGLFFKGFAPVRTLLVDHTLAFPRVAWTFLLPGLVFFGYSWSTVFWAGVALYLAYVVIEAATWATSALLVVHPSARRLWRGWWVIPFMPAYRYLLFWMRFAGTLTVITEAHQWRTKDPVTATREYALTVVKGKAAPAERAKAA